MNQFDSKNFIKACEQLRSGKQADRMSSVVFMMDRIIGEMYRKEYPEALEVLIHLRARLKILLKIAEETAKRKPSWKKDFKELLDMKKYVFGLSDDADFMFWVYRLVRTDFLEMMDEEKRNRHGTCRLLSQDEYLLEKINDFIAFNIRHDKTSYQNDNIIFIRKTIIENNEIPNRGCRAKVPQATFPIFSLNFQISRN